MFRPRLSLLALSVAIAASACNLTAPPATTQPPATAAPAAPVAPPPPPALGLYVTNEQSGDLSIIDVGTSSVVDTVKLGKRPRGIVASPDGTTLYIALSGSPAAPPGVDEKTLPPPDRSADGIGVVDIKTRKLLKFKTSRTDPEQLDIPATTASRCSSRMKTRGS